MIGEKMMTGSGIPYSYGCIIACRGDKLAIGRPGHRIYCIGMATAGEAADSGLGLPHLHSRINACRGEKLAIGRPGHRHNRFIMTLRSEEMVSRVCPPNLDDLIGPPSAE